jgi:hypothetical protein
MQGRLFVDGLRYVLVKSGFSESEAGKYLFHGWWHFYASYLMGKLEKKLLKSQTDHKTDIILARYGEHRIDGDRKIIQVIAVKTFGVLFNKREAINVLPEINIERA